MVGLNFALFRDSEDDICVDLVVVMARITRKCWRNSVDAMTLKNGRGFQLGNWAFIVLVPP